MATKFPHDEDNQDYQKPFPKFKKPKIISYFSKDEQGEVRLDDSSKRFIKLSDLQDKLDCKLEQPIDLMYDLDRFVPLNEEGEERVLHLLSWIKENRSTVYDEFNARLDYDFVMSGGSLRLILTTPYNRKRTQEFLVYKLNETIYVFAKKYRVRGPNNEVPEREQVLSNIGHKFEIVMTSPTFDGEPDTSDIIYETKRLYYVLDTKINRHKILYSAKVDSVDQLRNKETDEVESEIPVELCIVKGQISDMPKWRFQRGRLLDYWCKAFLAGIQNTLIGFRNDDYVVGEMTILKTDSIPKEINKSKNSFMWSPNVCANFADSLLSFIKSQDLEDKQFYKVTRIERDVFSILPTDDDYQTFPDWYVNEFSDVK